MLSKTVGVISSTTITRMTVILLSSKNMHVHAQLLINWCILVLWLPFTQAQFQFTLKCRSDSDDDTLYLDCTCQDSNPQLESRLDEIERFFTVTTPPCLSLSVTNCSKLLITSDFSKLWRELYTELKLTLNNIEEIRHEPPPLQDFQIMPAILITFSVSNSSIETLFPGLVSHTETLNFKLTNCSVKKLAANAFQSVNTLQAFHINSSNIEMWSSAMPRIVTMQSLPDETKDQYLQLTGSTIKIMDAHALAIRMNSDEYFTISKTLIENLHDSAIQVHGLGHVVILDSNITEASDESFMVDFKGNVTSDQILSSVTIIKSHFRQSSFLQQWQVTNGPIVFMQSSFLDQTLVDMAKFLDKPTANVTIQETTLLCNCESLDPFLNPSKTSDNAKAKKESEDTTTELAKITTNEVITTITTVAEFTIDTSASGEPNPTTETQPVGDTSSTISATTISTSTSTGQPPEPDQYDNFVPSGEARLTADALVRTKRNKEDKLSNLIATGQCLPSQDDQRLSQYYFGQCNTVANFILNQLELDLLMETKVQPKSPQTALIYSTVGVGCLLVTLIGTAFIRFLINRSKKGILKVTSRRQAKMGVVSEEPIYEDEEEC